MISYTVYNGKKYNYRKPYLLPCFAFLNNVYDKVGVRIYPSGGITKSTQKYLTMIKNIVKTKQKKGVKYDFIEVNFKKRKLSAENRINIAKCSLLRYTCSLEGEYYVEIMLKATELKEKYKNRLSNISCIFIASILNDVKMTSHTILETFNTAYKDLDLYLFSDKEYLKYLDYCIKNKVPFSNLNKNYFGKKYICYKHSEVHKILEVLDNNKYLPKKIKNDL